MQPYEENHYAYVMCSYLMKAIHVLFCVMMTAVISWEIHSKK